MISLWSGGIKAVKPRKDILINTEIGAHKSISKKLFIAFTTLTLPKRGTVAARFVQGVVKISSKG